MPSAENQFLACLLVFPRPLAWLNALSIVPAFGANLENVPFTTLRWGGEDTEGIPCAPVPLDNKVGLGFFPFLAYPEGTEAAIRPLPLTTDIAQGLSALLRSARSPPAMNFAKLSAWAAGAESEGNLDPAKLDTKGMVATVPRRQWCEYSAAELEEGRAAAAAATTKADPTQQLTRGYSWQATQVEGDPLASISKAMAGASPLLHPPPRRDSTRGSDWESLLAGGGQPVAAPAGSAGLKPPSGWTPFHPMSEQDFAILRQRWDMRQDHLSADSEPPARASMVDGTFDIKDDGHAVLGGMRMRLALRPPNLPASRWWDDDALGVSTVLQEPVRGSSLFTGDITGSKSMNPSTVKKLHNRKSRLTHKALLLKNNGSIPMGRSFFLDNGEDNLSALTSNPEAGFKAAENLKELEEGLHLWAAAIHGIRSWSYEAHALLFCMSDISYFMGCASSPKAALDLSIKVVDKVLAKNTCRAREGGAPLTSREIFDFCKVSHVIPSLSPHSQSLLFRRWHSMLACRTMASSGFLLT